MGFKASRQLTITPKPYKSSNLAIPVSPFSPQLPISPKPSAPKIKEPTSSALRFEYSSPPPQQPLHWLWQCHVCNRCYQLGVTRRCLDDGHYFCSGSTVVKRGKRGGGAGKKVICHRACQSEFDYQGWKTWGLWRRGLFETAMEEKWLTWQFEGLDDDEGGSKTTKKKKRFGDSLRVGRKKDCWNACDYPSECRWGKKCGVRSPRRTSRILTVSSASDAVPSIEEEHCARETLDGSAMDTAVVDDLLGDGESSATRISTTFSEEEAKKPSMDDLLESVKRRKRRSAGLTPSPLASHPSSSTSAEQDTSTAQTLQKALDDMESDFVRSFARAGNIVSSWISGRRQSSSN